MIGTTDGCRMRIAVINRWTCQNIMSTGRRDTMGGGSISTHPPPKTLLPFPVGLLLLLLAAVDKRVFGLFYVRGRECLQVK
jgi:hypothetical protein